MAPRLFSRDSSSLEHQLPFTGDAVHDADFAHDQSQAEQGAQTLPRRIRAQSLASGTLPGSYTRNPVRSFAHQTSHGFAETPQYASQGVRERSSQLASYALDSEEYQDRPQRHSFAEADTVSGRHAGLLSEYHGGRASPDSALWTDTIEEDSEAETPETTIGPQHADRSFFSPKLGVDKAQRRDSHEGSPSSEVPDVVVQDTERTPLLPAPRLSRLDPQSKQKPMLSQSSHSSTSSTLPLRIKETFTSGREHVLGLGRSLANPKNYSKDALVSGALGSVQIISAVFLGLLLNLLDALSYGYILFPLGSPIFSQTGPDGISIFFVSCIVSQLCYSLGLSVFKGGVGSEMIEVVPFFHKMAYSIMGQMEDKPPEAVIATTIVAYCLSSILTGLIFLALGGFKLGNLVSFFPRHILIGCIGGVGFFLVVTGIEVSARIEGNLNYDLATLHKLFSSDTWYLWILPLSLAIIIMVLQRLVKHPSVSPYLLPAFFITVFATFYLIVKGILHKDLEPVRNAGWIFEQPEAGVKFYRFYSYFKFGSIDVSALASTIPTMFALSFFGIIHVPINVPALGAAVKEDSLDVNRELIAHGISNTLSGFFGSIQNYLVYANSVMFIANGGNSRVAGVLLAFATTAVWIAGPAMIGYIPICLVGALIFLLGIDLMKEALWDTWGKCHKLEYLTILAIVLIMGVHDFVVGIFVGIVLACVSYVVQSSRHPAIRASYSGVVAESTVRRPPADTRYLNKVRGQVRVIKLGGFLFFGTIVSVEEYMRSLIEDDNYEKHPIGFIIVDFMHVNAVDFSSSEGFQRINRILNRKNVKMVLSGVSFANDVGQALQNVGLLDEEEGDDDCPPPQVFEDLNTALESCENELLEVFHRHCNMQTSRSQHNTPPMTISKGLSVNGQTATGGSPTSSFGASSLNPVFASPRRGARLVAARSTMRETGDDTLSIPDNSSQSHTPSVQSTPSRWKNFAQPLKIILQTFEDVSSKNEDFWHVLAPYFERKEYPAGALLYSRGDDPDGFYILEKGRFRTEYELDQGSFFEVILPGTTCGELPFFSETDRTGTVAVENDSVAWLLTREKFNELEKKDQEAARELLKVGLKLTKERMDAITSYVLVTAS
ncbi:sulfate transporter family protein-like protein [Cucurbitaria berberidis CBS 394.84]|uniref:Sulfate transporter family protein-like protein n=1 Tax=Cucurbitaria berberidis CBS 394.84 TaxID=1168544 RepID=A0A9P4G7U0_9PLEO|nr:sulfate transporter family protein-like protein [Cucurbitaria berberidis CBS 394.84]KAF1840643.1 sulfate transporter family protein-like protein [Cucurbitaria berberidis CBS 394.84]